MKGEHMRFGLVFGGHHRTGSTIDHRILGGFVTEQMIHCVYFRETKRCDTTNTLRLCRCATAFQYSTRVYSIDISLLFSARLGPGAIVT